MTTIGAADFKQRCLQLIDEVGPEGITITKRGKPVARLVPVRTNDGDLSGALEGRIIIDPFDDLFSTGAWASHESDGRELGWVTAMDISSVHS